MGGGHKKAQPPLLLISHCLSTKEPKSTFCWCVGIIKDLKSIVFILIKMFRIN